MSFDSLTEKTILQISDDIEKADKNYSLEIEYEEGVLTIETIKGKYILNKNSPMKELWLSSPISGAHHFRFDSITGEWTNKTQKNLFNLLKDELLKIDINVAW
ncbi:MAG: iron donor protein CyaY [Rickettsiaceae bacterium H1]|nr:iron donor protein CyaY [Rickettsiaceae bacterium H1]